MIIGHLFRDSIVQGRRGRGRERGGMGEGRGVRRGNVYLNYEY